MPEKSLRIRRAVSGDAHLLAELGARTFFDTYHPDSRPEDNKRDAAANFALRQVEGESADPAAIRLLATAGGKAVGYAVLRDGEKRDAVKGPAALELVRVYLGQEEV